MRNRYYQYACRADDEQIKELRKETERRDNKQSEKADTLVGIASMMDSMIHGKTDEQGSEQGKVGHTEAALNDHASQTPTTSFPELSWQELQKYVIQG